MAKPRRKSASGLFEKASARRRRDEFIRQRWRIFRDAPTYGGLFTSADALADPACPESRRRWMDVSFLALDGRRVWHAEIVTADRAFEDAVEALAQERARALLTEEELAEALQIEWRPVPGSGGTGYWGFYSDTRPRAALGGLTLQAYEAKLRAEIRAQEPPAIHEGFKINPEFPDGHLGSPFHLPYAALFAIVVDAPQIDRATVEQAILRFRALGEKNWTNPEPVPLDRALGEGGQAGT